MAPEIMRAGNNNGKNPYTHASDIYAYGVVLYEIFAGELPYQNKSFIDPAMVIYMVGSGKMKPDLNRLNPKPSENDSNQPGAKSTPKMIRELIENSLLKDPTARPIFQENS